MTNLEGNPEVENCEYSRNFAKVIKPRSVKLTTRSGIKVDRLLPNSAIRMIGPWCFLDHFLPQEDDQIMSISAHPHTGLQTVTWFFSGEVHHHDSLGSNQKIQGQIFGIDSETEVFSPLVAAEVTLKSDNEILFELNESFEYGFMAYNETFDALN